MSAGRDGKVGLWKLFPEASGDAAGVHTEPEAPSSGNGPLDVTTAWPVRKLGGATADAALAGVFDDQGEPGNQV